MNRPLPSLIDKVRATIRRHAMAEPGLRVLAAVSGGPDSTCLFHALRELGCVVEVAHFDHQTRDGGSAEDAAFVRELAQKAGAPFHEGSEPVAAIARRMGSSFEVCARERRYAFLKRTAVEAGIEAIATGHHADDLAETVLMRLMRGTAPAGLAGIPPVRRDGPVRIVRPLLDCSRADILRYLETRGIPYRTDESNQDVRFLRNRVRHELLPLLERQYNPTVRDGLVRLAGIQRDENLLLDAMGRELLEACRKGGADLHRQPFRDAPPALQRRALALFCYETGAACAYATIEKARRLIVEGHAGQACDLGNGFLLRNARRTASIDRTIPDEKGEVALAVPGETWAWGRRYCVQPLETFPRLPWKTYCTPSRQVFDADKISGALHVRRRRDGDRFSPLGMQGATKLKDYLIGLGMPRAERGALDLLIAGDRIAWVVGHAIDGRFSVTSETARILLVTVE